MTKNLTRMAYGRLNSKDKDLARRMAEWRQNYRVTAVVCGALLGVSDNSWHHVEKGHRFALPEFATRIEALIAAPPPGFIAPVVVPVAAPLSDHTPAWVRAQLGALNKRLSALETALGVQTPTQKMNAVRAMPNGKELATP